MNDNQYTDKIKEADINGVREFLNLPDGYDIEATTDGVNIDFTLELNAKNWGLKSIDVTVKNVRATISWSIDSEDMDEEEKAWFIKAGGTEMRNDMIEGEIEINTELKQPNGMDWELLNEATFAEDGAFIFTSVEIYFQTKTITIS